MFNIINVASGRSEEAKNIENIGEKKAEFAERHMKRLSFWQGLLSKAKGKTELHATRKGIKDNYLAAGAGVSGFKYICRIP